MAVQKKKIQGRSKPKASDKYQIYYLLFGLLLVFLALVALFNWGFMGTFMVNHLRLLVGQSYDLVLTGILIFALYLMAKGQVPGLSLAKVSGGVLILLSISLILHFRDFSGLGSNKVYADVFDIFRNELTLSQIAQPMGGGLLGSFLYKSFGFWFGQWGSYLLCALVFLMGLFLVVNINFLMIKKSLEDLFAGIHSLTGHMYDSIDQARDIVADQKEAGPKLKTSHESQYQEKQQTTFDSEDLSKNIHPAREEDFEDAYYDEELPNKGYFLQGSRLGRFFSQFFEDNYQGSNPYQGEDYYEDLGDWDYDDARDPNISSDFPSPNLAEEAHDKKFDSFNKEREIESYRGYAEAGPDYDPSDLDTSVLDLDYFERISRPDLMDEKGHLSNDFDHTSSSLDDRTVDSDQSNETYHESQGVDMGGDLDQDRLGEGTPNIPSESDTPAKASELGAASPSKKAMPAERWQDKAHVSQNLTGNELDQALQGGGSSEKSSKSKRSAKRSARSKTYRLPTKSLLTKIPPVDQSEEYDRINHNIDKLERTFESFGVDAKVVKANLGPAVTKYEIEPAVGVKVSKIVSLADDIALALAARDVRMEAPIPGKSLIGIEVPNTQVSPVSFWEIIDAALKSKNLLEVPLGRDVSGSVCLADLAKMPHLLIAGATGSGKSVGMNVIIVSLLMKARPGQVKFLMVDPKKVELTMYNDLPHLLAPVVTNPRKAAKALNNVVQEMERRYELFAETGVRNLDAYNDHIEELNKKENTGYEHLPKIVVFIDELADLMLVASNEVESAIIRLAQMARAAGIHMIIATQRPSVDVITGIIKANVPSRLAFAVSSGTDSRTILDANGAEKLLGRGDMLFQPMGKNKPVRVQGAYISDEEVERITDMIKDQMEPNYDENILVSQDSMEMDQASDDEYFQEAVELIQELDTISISQLQRRFRIGYNRAARLIDDLEKMGYVSEQDGSKPRQVLLNQ